jgi:putative nucleotidyltransferase with HDIG domain
MQCPGQDSRYWNSEAVFESTCPHCGARVEFFKDDSQRTCRACGQRLLNPKMDFGCASYCPYAEQCLGSLPPERAIRQGQLFKDKVAAAMQEYFGPDRRRIAHALAVADRAEILAKEVEGVDMMVVMASAYLHDIGIREAERKYHSSAFVHQHQEGPPVAREILTRLQAKPALIEEVCEIIGHHHSPREEESINFKILYDADLLVNCMEQHQEKGLSEQGMEHWIGKMLTPAGVRLAHQELSQCMRSGTL